MVIPMIAYEDGVGALEWLAKAFGFRENERWTEPDGTLSHGEMETGDGSIMLATPTPDYESPKGASGTLRPRAPVVRRPVGYRWRAGVRR